MKNHLPSYLEAFKSIIGISHIVEIREHNPLYKEIFHKESDRILSEMNDMGVMVHHVGSTSIIGLCAKPIIDMLLVYENTDFFEDIRKNLTDLGYIFREDLLPERIYFVLEDENKIRYFSVSVYRKNDSRMKEILNFKENLLRNPQLIQEYSEIKMNVSKMTQNREDYTKRKSDFVKTYSQQQLSTPNLDQYWIDPSNHPLSQVRGPDWWKEPNILFPGALAKIPFFPDDGYRLLDIGCGTGTHPIAAAKLGWQVDAFDGSVSAVEYAQEFAREQQVDSLTHFSVNYFSDFPYPEGKYAGVFSFNALHHDTEESMRESVEKVYKSLIPGGKLFLTLPLHSTSENYGDQIAPHTFLPNSGHEKGVPHVLFDDVFVEDVFGKYFIIECDENGKLPFADSRHYFLTMTKKS